MTRILLPEHDIVGIRADNPGPLTLSGTNTWIIGRDPAWLIDPGPALEEHVAALVAEAEARGGLGGVALTHSHADHSDAVAALLERFAVPVGSFGVADTRPLRQGDRFGPLSVLELPGHAPDHLLFLSDGVAFSGDAILGEGSVFISPDPGALAGYLNGLKRLRAQAPAVIAPGHGPVIDDPDARISQYVAHRLEREAKLVDALEQGRRSIDDLLDAAWSEVPEPLRFAAAITMAAHLDKLADEGRLPEGVERPRWPL